MSGPVEDQNGEVAERGFTTIEVREGRTAEIGRLKVSRILPTKRRRTIGPWCFVDMMHPGDVAEPPPLEIGPHPHIGLSTATWLLTGSALHSASLGTEQLIRPGQLPGHGLLKGLALWRKQDDKRRSIHPVYGFQCTNYGARFHDRYAGWDGTYDPRRHGLLVCASPGCTA